MSQPRRRRRRRRRGPPRTGDQQREQAVRREQASQEPGSQRRSRRRRGRRGKTQESKSPPLSEDLVRALPKEKPATLSAPEDGQTLEGLIGDLQSVWGVPQYPQEYRITVKIQEDRDRSDQSVVVEDEAEPSDGGRAPGDRDVVVREKAPAAPLMRNRGDGGATREKAPRRRRRRRRGGGSGSGSG